MIQNLFPAGAREQHATGCQSHLPPLASPTTARWCHWPRQQAVRDGQAASSNPMTGSARHIQQPLLPAPRSAGYPRARQDDVSGWGHPQSTAAPDQFPELPDRRHRAYPHPPLPLPDTRLPDHPFWQPDGAPVPPQNRSGRHHARGGHITYAPGPAPTRRQVPNQADQPPAPDAANRYNLQDGPHPGAAGGNATGARQANLHLNPHLNLRPQHVFHSRDTLQ